MTPDTDEQMDLSDYDLGFMRGVFAARGIAEPSDDQMRDALELLQLHHGAPDALLN